MALSDELAQGRPLNLNEMAQSQLQQGVLGAQQQQLQAQTQSAQQELENKRRALAVSMLNGISNEQDPNKQAALYSTLKPMAERYDPTLKLPDDYDPGIAKALIQSQIPAEKQAEMQAELQKAQILAGGHIVKDAFGNLVRASDVPGTGGSAAPGVGQVDANGQPVAAPTAQPTSFGFDLGGTNPMVLKQQAATDAKRLQSYQANHQRVVTAKAALDTMEPQLDNFDTGSAGSLRMAADKAGAMFLPDSLGGDSLKSKADAANNIDKASNDLVTQLQGFEYVPGQRAGVLGLKTLIASKPGVDQQEATNKNIIPELRGRLDDYETTEQLAQAYKEASPLHVINEGHVNQLDDALKTLFPINSIDPKTGKTQYHPENVQSIQDAIPAAIAEPQKFIQAAKMAKAKAMSAPADQQAAQPDSSQPTPQQPAANTAPEGTIIHDGKGKVLVKRGGQWVAP